MTHCDTDAAETYIYPTNYPLREYQFNIVKNCLLKNTLVCLPTGLGKTFIAAVLMYNYYRWFPNGKVVFLAPTKPLVTQQIEACFSIMGIPQDDTAEMTGSIAPEARKCIWKDKKVFFLTPQVLMNDLMNKICPARSISFVAIDEAHKALGNHAYCQVIKILRDQFYNFRVLALSATPGSDMIAVQQVLANLFISHVEVRTDESPDILPYVFDKSIEQIVIPMDPELQKLKDQFMRVTRYYIQKLVSKGALFSKNEENLSKYQILKAREVFRSSHGAHHDRSTLGHLEATFALCITLYHALELLITHSVRSFYGFLKSSLNDKQGHNYSKSELMKNTLFVDLMENLKKEFDLDLNGTDSRSETFGQSSNSSTLLEVSTVKPSHPKMKKLVEVLLNHFRSYQETKETTRVIVFSQYRESVYEISALLEPHRPLIKPMSFFGQTFKGGRGNTQKEQMRIMKLFRSGEFNTLVSTCVGEEGLDIGEVDLIVCYDAPKSPVRLIQRIGRTGRKRSGRVIVLISKGKEEQSYNQSQLKRRSLVSALTKGDRLAKYLFPSPRMIPEGIVPVCLKLKMQVNEYIETKSKVKKRDPFRMMEEKKNEPYMSIDQWKTYNERFRTKSKTFKIQTPMLMDMDDALQGASEAGGDRTMDFGEYQPWYNTLQPFFEVSHSKASQNLVGLTEFINLQLIIGDNDNYGAEMAPFLNQKYLGGKSDDTENKNKIQNPEQSSNKSQERPEDVPKNKRNAKSKNKKGKRNSKASNVKKSKGIRSFLVNLDHSKRELNNSKDKSEEVQVLSDLPQPLSDIPQVLEVDNDIPQAQSDLNESIVILEDQDLEKQDLKEQNLENENSVCDIESLFRSSPCKKSKPIFESPPSRSVIRNNFYKSSYITLLAFNHQIENEKLRKDNFKRYFDENMNEFEGIECLSLSDNDISDAEKSFEEVNRSPIIYSQRNKIHSNRKLDTKIPINQNFKNDDFIDENLMEIDCLPLHKENLGCELESSVLLTPEHAKVQLKTDSLAPSPIFASKRPPWADNSSFICSSTPITDKAKKMLKNSSINITPISVTSESKFSKFLKEESVKNQINENIPKENCLVENNHAEKGFKGKTKAELCQVQNKIVDEVFSNHKNSSIANFELFDEDDELFANIDLENITQESVNNNFKSKPVPITHKDNKTTKKLTEKNNLLSVTQVIDLVNLNSQVKQVNDNSNKLKAEQIKVSNKKFVKNLSSEFGRYKNPKFEEKESVESIEEFFKPKNIGSFKSSKPIKPIEISSTEPKNCNRKEESKLFNQQSSKFKSFSNINNTHENSRSHFKTKENRSKASSELYELQNKNTETPASKVSSELYEIQNKNSEIQVSNTSKNLELDSLFSNSIKTSHSKHEKREVEVQFNLGLDLFDDDDETPVKKGMDDSLSEDKVKQSQNNLNFNSKSNKVDVSFDLFDESFDLFEDVEKLEAKHTSTSNNINKETNLSKGLTKSKERTPNKHSLMNNRNSLSKEVSPYVYKSNISKLKPNDFLDKDSGSIYPQSTSKNQPYKSSIEDQYIDKEIQFKKSLQSLNKKGSDVCEIGSKCFDESFKIKGNASYNRKEPSIHEIHCDSTNQKENISYSKKKATHKYGSDNDTLNGFSKKDDPMSSNNRENDLLDNEIECIGEVNGMMEIPKILNECDAYSKEKSIHNKSVTNTSHNSVNKSLLKRKSRLLSKSKNDGEISVVDEDLEFDSLLQYLKDDSKLFDPESPKPLKPKVTDYESKFTNNESNFNLNESEDMCDKFVRSGGPNTDKDKRFRDSDCSEDSPIIQKRKKKMIQDSDESKLDNISDYSVSHGTSKKTGINLSDHSVSHDFGTLQTKDKSSREFKQPIVPKNVSSDFSDDDFDIPGRITSVQPPVTTVREKTYSYKPKLKTRHALINVEADVTDDSVVNLSSDESESDLNHYDSSFVDDEQQEATQRGVDMKAVYLRSVRSPVKNPKDHAHRRPKLTILSGSEDSETEIEEDSFVVDNDFVEYETQYMGDSMLALDPIMDVVPQEVRPKKTNKRRRIVQWDGSSDEDTPKKTTNTTHESSNLDNIPDIDKTISKSNSSLPKKDVLITKKDMLSQDYMSVPPKSSSVPQKSILQVDFPVFDIFSDEEINEVENIPKPFKEPKVDLRVDNNPHKKSFNRWKSFDESSKRQDDLSYGKKSPKFLSKRKLLSQDCQKSSQKWLDTETVDISITSPPPKKLNVKFDGVKSPHFKSKKLSLSRKLQKNVPKTKKFNERKFDDSPSSSAEFQ